MGKGETPVFDIKDDDIKNLESDLKTFKFKAFPFATKQTVNKAAFTAQKIARKNVRNSMIRRNKFTIQSIQVEPTKTLHIRSQEAIVGSIADYMEDQEFGATKTKQGKRGVPIATSYSAGQSQDSQPRTRLPKLDNQLAAIHLKKRKRRGSNKKQRIAVAISQAVRSGQKFIFLDLGRTEGIFRIVGGSSTNTSGARLKMLHNLSNDSVDIPANPWLKPAVDDTRKLMPSIYKKALEFQVKRLGLFR